MSGIFFDLPSVRFLRRFRFLEPMLQTIAASLFRWLSAPACALRQVHFRHDEAEFPSASQSGCKQFDWTLDDSRAADRVPNLFGALRPFNHWTKIKDKHELLFRRKTLPPLARGWADAKQITNAFEIDRKQRRRRKKHSGNGLPNFSETEGRKEKQQRSHAMVRSPRDRRANPSALKSLRPVCTLAICRSTLPRAICLNCSTEWGTCKMPRS